MRLIEVLGKHAWLRGVLGILRADQQHAGQYVLVSAAGKELARFNESQLATVSVSAYEKDTVVIALR